MPQYNEPSLVTSMASDDIILVWKTASGSVQTITFSDFAATIAVAAGGGIPGGSATQLQFNNAGSFGGIPSATYDGVSLTLDSPIINTPVGITKTDVGLANVDNTTDLNKPISTATQTALNLKAPIDSPGFTGTPTSPTPTLGDNSTKIANTAFVSSAIAALGVLGTVTSVSVASANGFAGTVATATTTPAITISTSVTGMLYGNGTAVSASKVVLTQPATGSTITVLDGKTITVNKTLTLTGTDGTTMTFPSTSATIARVDAANTWAAGVRQTFGPNATNPGFNPGSNAGDPSTPINGDIWYDSTGNLLRARINGATVTLGGGGGSGTVNAGTATQFAYYPASSAAVSSTSTMTVSATGRLTLSPTAVSSGAVAAITLTPPADTGITVNAECNGLLYSAVTRTFTDGTISSQREVVISAPTYNKTTTAVTCTTAATFAIANAPTAGAGFSVTNLYALWVQAGTSRFDGLVSIGSSLGLSVTPAATSSGSATKVVFTQPSDTGVTANQEMAFIDIQPATVTHANGSYANDRCVRVRQGTIAFTSAGTVTSAYTFAIDGPPQVGGGATLTTKWSFGVLTGNVRLGGQLIFLDTGEAALTTSPGISQTSGLLTMTSSGGLNLRTGGTLSIAASGAFDTVWSDSTTTTTWQGAAVTGRGMYQQRTGSLGYFGLSSQASAQVNFEGDVCQGSYGSLTATDNNSSVRLSMRTYGGSTWVNNGYIIIQTTQAQSETARGCKINFGTTVNTTTPALTQMTLDNDGSLKLFNATGGLGYGTGAGLTVTQGTSRTTGVTINAVCGAITLFSAAGSATPASFTVTNSTVAATDTVLVTQKSGTDLYEIFVTNIAAGSFKITSFTTGGTTTEQPVFKFVVIKAVEA